MSEVLLQNENEENTDLQMCNDIYREIGEQIGVGAMLKIFYLFKGQQITFPVRLYCSEKIRERISVEYNGKNIKDLAKKYSYSEKTVARMLGEGKKR